MSQPTTKPVTFEEFIDFDDGNELNEYELVDGGEDKFQQSTVYAAHD
jgi:Uma2 family endonuclease